MYEGEDSNSGLADSRIQIDFCGGILSLMILVSKSVQTAPQDSPRNLGMSILS